MSILRDQVNGRAIPGGHFMMEESPQIVQTLLATFLSDVAHRHPLPVPPAEVPQAG
jgi:hypothetical protein